MPGVRREVDAWRAKGWPGVTETTRTLLNFWFDTDHRLKNGRPFSYHESQRRAVESLIYLYEVAGIRSHKALLEKYVSVQTDMRLLRYDLFARFCVKMATGSGKTKVMALAVAWQFFNAAVSDDPSWARSFLVIAPNVIVFERLKIDFYHGRIFKNDPIIPPELRIYWDMEFYMREESERAHSLGALYLSNIQQFYERPDRSAGDETGEMTAVLGPRPPAALSGSGDFAERLFQRGERLFVINDEAHHTHDEESEWNKCLRGLHAALEGKKKGITAQLDMTATPRHSKGALFSWTIYDYPLKQAIQDGIVKRPMKGIARIPEARSTVASTRYRGYLTAAVERWREYREQLAPLKKKPILFVMLNDTDEADDVGEYLKTKYPAEFGGDKLLVIHTDKSGEVSKQDLDKARRIARRVDEEQSPVNAIVSVLMLREGWDVQNVTVIVGLRPYTSKANILPEQTIGRGLRLMFRGFATDYVERVDIIGNTAFLSFVEKLEKEEGIALGSFELGTDKLEIITIMPDPAKMDKDIAIPLISPILERKKTLADEIGAIDVASMSCSTFPVKRGTAEAETFRYEGFDILTLEKMLDRNYTLPAIQTPEEVIGYYAKHIAAELKLPSQFAVLAPKVRQFLETRAFGKKVDLNESDILKAISSNFAQYVTVDIFMKKLKPLVVQELTPRLLEQGRPLSTTPPFPFSKSVFPAAKTVYNRVACQNEFENEFAGFLERASDVKAFAKLPEQFGFTISYMDSKSNLRYYEPDFVVLLEDGRHFLVETKGREDVDVIYKDNAAATWCENASLLSGTNWHYVKVPQAEFQKLQADSFSDLEVFQGS